ncbi:MAG: hypothetical protein R8M37_03440 [Alphaproteobacteria bacterium]|nr:hypothetical protein [Alphaproteobacteria bacterium]
MFAFFVVNAVYQNAKSDFADPLFKKSVVKVIVASIVSLSMLMMGVNLPRVISTITFEPVASITLTYTQSMIKLTDEQVEEKVTYQPMKMRDDGFYRPELRNKIIQLMKTSITQFQSYIKLGIAMMDEAFSWEALLGIGALIKHFILFMIGAFLFYHFFKLFFRYCCYFADVIISMAFFAFFFPLSLILMSFKDAEYVPKWFNSLGKNVGANQVKNLINAIITLGSTVLTFTVCMVILAKFFSAPGASVNDLMSAITSGQIYDDDLNTENLQAITLSSCIVLVYVLRYVTDQIPNVTKMILSAFGVDENKKYGDELANDMMRLTGAALDTAKNLGTTIISGAKGKLDAKKEEKPEKKGGK